MRRIPLSGIMGDSVANYSGDMVVDVATDDASAPTDAELIGPESIIEAKLTLGDKMDTVSAIAMHSVCYARLVKLQFIEFQQNPATGMQIPYYLDMMVIVDDSMPVTAGTNRVTYTSILCGPGAIGFGNGETEYPLELERKASIGNGGGADILHSRETYIIAPRGYEFTSDSVVGVTPTLVELKNADNWKRSYDYRNNVPFAFLNTNG
jgi:hypothetical protein